MSSPNMNNVIACGCIISYISVIVKGMDVSLVVCQICPWVLSLGFTISYGAIFSKVWRIYTIFTNKSLKRKAIKDRTLFGIVAFLVTLNVGILMAQQFSDPLYMRERHLPGEIIRANVEGNTSFRYILYECKENLTLYWMIVAYGWNGLLLVFGIFLTWSVRNVHLSGLNDSRHIGICIYNVVIFSVIGAPLSHLLDDDVTASYLIIGGFILFCTTLTLALVFVPKKRIVQPSEGMKSTSSSKYGAALTN